MHGGKGGAPQGERNGRYRRGRDTKVTQQPAIRAAEYG